MPGSDGKRRVSLLISSEIGYGAGVLRGIAERADRHGRWLLKDDLRNWLAADGPTMTQRPDGIIFGPLHGALRRRIAALGVPAVAVTAAPAIDTTPHVAHDHRAAGVMAARHLLLRGYCRLAYFGSADPLVSRFAEAHCAGVRDVAKADGVKFDVFVPGRHTAKRWTLDGQIADLAGWLSQLTPPVGVMTWDDEHAHRVCLAVREAKLHCPDQVGVVSGCTNNIHCLITSPKLTGITVDERAVGYEAAKMLEQLFEGRRPRGRLLPPGEMSVRESTMLFAADDPLVAEAMRLIWHSLEDGVQVQGIADRLGVSRRTLTRRFQAALGRSPSEEIVNARVETAKRLLLQTRLPLADVAIRCGYEYISHLSRAVKQATGVPPSVFRQRHARGAAGG